MSEEVNRRRNKQFIWTLLTALISAIIVSSSAIVYTGIQTDENNRQWCELLIPLDNAYTSVPPTTPLGRKVSSAIHKLRHDFKC